MQKPKQYDNIVNRIQNLKDGDKCDGSGEEVIIGGVKFLVSELIMALRYMTNTTELDGGDYAEATAHGVIKEPKHHREFIFALIEHGRTVLTPTIPLRVNGKDFSWKQVLESLHYVNEQLVICRAYRPQLGEDYQVRAVIEHQVAYQRLLEMGWRPPIKSTTMAPKPINYNIAPGLVTYDFGSNSLTAIINVRLSADGPLLEKVIMPLSGDENFKVYTDPHFREVDEAPAGFQTIMKIDAKGKPGEVPRDIKIARKFAEGVSNAAGLQGSPGHDPVNSPSHYTDGGIEVIDYLQAKLSPQEFIGFLRGNVLKYFSRAGKKQNAVEDFKKGDWYAERLVKTLTDGGKK